MTPIELLRTSLPARPASVAKARHAVMSRLHDQGLDGLTEVATLLTSELATNAVQHARTAFALAMEREGTCVRVEVSDGSRHAPRVRAVPGDDGADEVEGPGGLGLALVTALATRWGFEQRRGDGKVVWFELASA